MSNEIREAELQRERLIEKYINNASYTGVDSQADGVNHIAFVAKNLEKTIEFYSQIVGLKLLRVRTMDGDPASTQVFFDMGRGEMLAFLKLSSFSEKVQMGTGGVHHFALTVNRDQYAAFEHRLKESGRQYNTISHEILDSISTIDPNGLEVELSVWNIDPKQVSQVSSEN